MAEKFDAVIVGAGPAGCMAAYRLASEGMRVLVLERGEYPGSKNTSGAMLHAHGLYDLFPEFPGDAPVERFVVDRKIALLTAESSLTVDFKDRHFADPPYNGFTVLRSKFDQWLAQKAEGAGALVMTGAQVDDLIKEGARVVGVRTRQDQGEVRADVVIIAEGANCVLTEKAGLRSGPPGEMAVAAKEIIKLSRDTINERFNLKGDEGASVHYIGACTKGVPGGGFIYTNRDSLSLGLVCRLSGLMERKLKISELVEEFKAHPHVHALIRGGKLKEYSGHMIPEGGYRQVPKLYAAGAMVVGEAASLNFNNGFIIRGMDYAMASGAAAARAVLRAREKNDFTENGLRAYQEELEASFVLKDMMRFRKLPDLLSNPRIYSAYPDLVCGLSREMFEVDGNEQRRMAAMIWEAMRKQGADAGLLTIIKDILQLGFKL
jgi:electron transfer flavoprotein-quinone oxidoreductase